MLSWYDNLRLSEHQVRNALNLQIVARLTPKKIRYPKDWCPRTQLDKLIARNMIMDMPIRKVMKIFPKFMVGFVQSVKGEQ